MVPSSIANKGNRSGRPLKGEHSLKRVFLGVFRGLREIPLKGPKKA